MILKSENSTVCLVGCKITSSTEIMVGMMYAEHQLEDIALVSDGQTYYKVQLPEAVALNKTYSVGVNQSLKYRLFS